MVFEICNGVFRCTDAACLHKMCLRCQVSMAFWILTLRNLASFLGIIKDSGIEDKPVSGYPSFPIAVRSRLLVGPSSYAIQTNPNYMQALNSAHWTPQHVLGTKAASALARATSNRNHKKNTVVPEAVTML